MQGGGCGVARVEGMGGNGGKDKGGGKGKDPKGRSDLALNDGVVGLVESHGKR